MSSEPQRSLTRPRTLAMAALVACATGGVGQAGPLPVDPAGPVFVPPLGGEASGQAFGQTSGQRSAQTSGPTSALSQTEAGRRALRLIESAQIVCRALPEAYLVSCLSERYEAAEKALPDTGEFAQPKEALRRAWNDLEDVARENRDRAQPRVNVRTEGPEPIETSRPLTPVAPERAEQALTEAEGILDEVETVLLRSAEASAERAALFTEMAQAVGSDKVLLRS